MGFMIEFPQFTKKHPSIAGRSYRLLTVRGGESMLRLIVWVQNMLKKIRRDHVSAFAAQSAYFLILSAIPFIIFLLTLLRFLPIGLDGLLDGLSLIIPAKYYSVAATVLNSIYRSSSTTLLSFSIITVIWSAGKGIMALANGLNAVNEIEENRSYIRIRLKAAFYTVLFAILIIFTLIFLVFGNRIFMWLVGRFPFFEDFSTMLGLIRTLFALSFYICLFAVFYKFLPASRMRILRQLPGAVFTASGWMISSYIFSLYVDYARAPSYMYGSLAYLMLFFLYLYMIMYIFFLGAELNYSLTPKKPDNYHLKY